jgi:hypothetical protein
MTIDVKRAVMLLCLAMTAISASCFDLAPLPERPDGSTSGDSDTDSDTDTDTDSDTDSDTDGDTLYQWHTFHGSSGRDDSYAIATFGEGVYITGESENTWDGPEGESPLNDHSAGFSDIFVLKLDLDGTYQWHTFFGPGAPDNYGLGIAADDSGVYIVGEGAASWNGPLDQPPLHGHSGDSDMFILKLGASGAYEWHSFYGSSAQDIGNAITVQGGVIVTGVSTAAWNGPSGELPHNAHSGVQADFHVMELDTDGTYLWHTFHGPSAAGTYVSQGVTADLSAIYVAAVGQFSWNGPLGQDPLHPFSDGGEDDILIVKLDASGLYQWHTFHGSNNNQRPHSIAMDGANIYTTGTSYDTWNGPEGQSPLDGADNGGGAYVLALDTDGEYQWHSFYATDRANSITEDEGYLYIAGGSNAGPWDGPEGQSPINESSYSDSPFILKLSTGGVYQWHSFYGTCSDTYDMGPSIAVTESGIYFVTAAGESWVGPVGQTPLNPYTGGDDISVAFLEKNP